MINSIVITGSSGFVGKNLINFLKNDFEIYTKSIRYKINQEFEIKEDAVIHSGGIAHDLNKSKLKKEYFESNFLLTKQLFDSFLNSDSKVFIFLSSIKVVSDFSLDPVTENSKENPSSFYGELKLKSENYLLNNITENKRVIILRPTMIYGLENKGNLNLLIKYCLTGMPWPLASFNNKRSLCSVNNLCYVIKKILLVNPGSGVYNVCDDESISTNELVKVIYSSKNKPAVLIKFPKILISFFGNVGDFFNLPFNSVVLKKLTVNFVVDNSKIKRNLKIDKMPNRLIHELKKTINALT